MALGNLFAARVSIHLRLRLSPTRYLIALCMAGIAVGSWLAMRRIRHDGHSASRSVASTQCLLALSAPALMLLVSLLAKASGTTATWIAAQCVFQRWPRSRACWAATNFPWRPKSIAATAGEASACSIPLICWAVAWARLR